MNLASKINQDLDPLSFLMSYGNPIKKLNDDIIGYASRCQFGDVVVEINAIEVEPEDFSLTLNIQHIELVYLNDYEEDDDVARIVMPDDILKETIGREAFLYLYHELGLFEGMFHRSSAIRSYYHYPRIPIPDLCQFINRLRIKYPNAFNAVAYPEKGA